MTTLILDKITANEQETGQVGNYFASLLMPGHVVGFYGELGSGKTTLIRGICSSLQAIEIVTSPTFTIINEYHARMPVYHFDFYRIRSQEELSELGLEEYFYGDGVSLIEWPEIAQNFLPKRLFKITLQWDYGKGQSNTRHIKIWKIE